MATHVLHGDCLSVLAEMPEASIDSVVTDAPYELGFMGKRWDASGIAYSVDLWKLVLRVLRPGGYLLACGGTRTYHRMTCAIEDAGFEIRDSVDWLYGSGFPKSLDVAKQIDALDRSREARRRALEFTAWMRWTGLTAAEIDAATGSNMGGHYLTEGQQPEIPTPEMFEKLRPLFEARGIAPTPEIEKLVVDRKVESENLAAREVIGRKEGAHDLLRQRPVSIAAQGEEISLRRTIEITDPFTAEARQWKGWGTALKPFHEPIVLARKPLDGTVAANVMEHGTGALNIDACRVPTTEEIETTRSASFESASGSFLSVARPEEFRGHTGGRWPPNLLLTHAADCTDTACVAGCPVMELDLQAGELVSGAMLAGTLAGRKSDVYSPDVGHPLARDIEASSGGASRFVPCFRWDLEIDVPFIYVPKPSRGERDAGLHDLAKATAGEATDRKDGSAGLRSPRAGAGRTGGGRNVHPTVKPVELMEWLVRLVTPPGGTVLDPFLGSGSTGCGAVRAGFEFIGIEKEDLYIPIAERRIALAANAPRSKALGALERGETVLPGQIGLFESASGPDELSAAVTQTEPPAAGSTSTTSEG